MTIRINGVSQDGGGLDNIVEDTSPQLGGDLDLNGHNIDFPTTANISDCLDEDDMSSDSATMLATQQSIKKYVDDHAGSSLDVACRVYRTTHQDIASGSDVTIQFTHENYDIGSNYNTGTYTFTTPSAGYYLCQLQVMFEENLTSGKQCMARIKYDGNAIASSYYKPASNSLPCIHTATIYYMESDKNVLFTINHNEGANLEINGTSDYYTWASISKIG